jgi:TonB family protein
MNQKLKIMNQKPELSDNDIRGYMDFEGLLEKRKAMLQIRHSMLKWGASCMLVMGIACWLLFYPRKTEVPPVTHQKNVETPLPQSRSQVPAPDSIRQARPAVNAEKKPAPVQKHEKKETVAGKEDAPATAGNVYVQAEPVAGYPALYEYFASNLVYPGEALKDSIQGVVTISFVINREGKAEKTEVKQSLGEPFEREAKRLIENMPLWKPATLNGKEVPSKMSLPLTFQIQKIKTQEQK